MREVPLQSESDDWNQNDGTLRPHLTGYDRQLLCYDDVDFLPTYELGEGYIDIQDPIWGDCHIGDKPGDELLLRLIDIPLVRRTMVIEQLTLDPYFSTIPNTSTFSRWEHCWGSLVFVRKMIEKEGLQLDSRQKLVMQLRTFVSDLGHTAFSHLGDWMFQGMDGPQNQHDLELKDILDQSGVTALLSEFGIDVDEVVFPEGEDWIECKSPGLCVDRVDYGLREMLRWQSKFLPIKDILGVENFTINEDGQLAFTSRKAAEIFFKGFSLLSTEHWGEPVHRVQERFLFEMVKRTLVRDGRLLVNWMEGWRKYHPRNYIYSVDRDFLESMEMHDPFMRALQVIGREIGQEQRNIFVRQRLGELAAYGVGKVDPERYPEPGVSLNRVGSMPVHSSRVEIIQVESPDEVSDLHANSHTVDFFLPVFKPRHVDPLFKERGTFKNLSANRKVSKIIKKQREYMGRAYVARVLMTPEYQGIIQEGLAENEAEWAGMLELPYMEPERFQELLRDAAAYSNHAFFNLRWYR